MQIVPFSLPRRNMNTDCNPNRLRKYHDKLDTHLTSRSRVATPDCSIDLKRMVNGNGSFTVRVCETLISLNVRLLLNSKPFP